MESFHDKFRDECLSESGDVHLAHSSADEAVAGFIQFAKLALALT